MRQVKLNYSAKYVEPPVEDLRTRVRFPPPPPVYKFVWTPPDYSNPMFSVGFFLSYFPFVLALSGLNMAGLARIFGTFLPQLFVGCGEYFNWGLYPTT